MSEVLKLVKLGFVLVVNWILGILGSGSTHFSFPFFLFTFSLFTVCYFGSPYMHVLYIF